MIAAAISAEPLAVWDASEEEGLFWQGWPATHVWAADHLGQEVANRTIRADFHFVDAPFAVLHQVVTDEDGRKLVDPVTGGPMLAEPVVQMLDELPPAHLLGR